MVEFRRPYSIKTRIKTIQLRFYGLWCRFADHIPSKQGLRRIGCLAQYPIRKFRRPYSIKTRIKTETPLFRWRLILQFRRPYSIKTRIKTLKPLLSTKLITVRRPYSIKTRIKTDGRKGCRYHHPPFADHIPSKQGLRPAFHSHPAMCRMFRRPYSIKTRIKTTVD